VQCRYKTTGVNPGSGLHWQIVIRKAMCSGLRRISLTTNPIEQSWILANSLPTGPVSLRLGYQRAAGHYAHRRYALTGATSRLLQK